MARTQATPVIIPFILPNAVPTKTSRPEPFTSVPIHIQEQRDDMHGTWAYTHSHYDILSDIMLILDHGNICVDTIFMIIIMHCFPDIEEN